MAGEIQLNSTTMATESSGSITAELDTIRPNTTNGSLTLQGDSSDAGVTGLTIDSSGVVNTTTAKVTNIQATSGQSLTIKDEDGNTAITIGTDNTAAGYLSLNFGSYHGDSGGAGSGTLSGNTLSDYEEGTYVVNMYDAASGGIASSTQVTGRYTKIGQVVIASFDSFNDVSTSDLTEANAVNFTLPFAASSTGRSTGTVQLHGVTFPNSTTYVVTSVPDNGSRATLNVCGSGIADTTVKVQNFGTSNDVVNWTLCYRTGA